MTLPPGWPLASSRSSTFANCLHFTREPAAADSVQALLAPPKSRPTRSFAAHGPPTGALSSYMSTDDSGGVHAAPPAGGQAAARTAGCSCSHSGGNPPQLSADSEGKACRLRLLSLAAPHMRSFHLAWLSHFVAVLGERRGGFQAAAREPGLSTPTLLTGGHACGCVCAARIVAWQTGQPASGLPLLAVPPTLGRLPLPRPPPAATFAAAPLLPVIRDNLDLTKAQVSAAGIAAVAGTVGEARLRAGRRRAPARRAQPIVGAPCGHVLPAAAAALVAQPGRHCREPGLSHLIRHSTCVRFPTRRLPHRHGRRLRPLGPPLWHIGAAVAHRQRHLW